MGTDDKCQTITMFFTHETNICFKCYIGILKYGRCCLQNPKKNYKMLFLLVINDMQWINLSLTLVEYLNNVKTPKPPESSLWWQTPHLFLIKIYWGENC